jgi:hypothetical protein
VIGDRTQSILEEQRTALIAAAVTGGLDVQTGAIPFTP